MFSQKSHYKLCFMGVAIPVSLFLDVLFAHVSTAPVTDHFAFYIYALRRRLPATF